ncbi:MAG: class II aldolase/adducin family protein [Terrimicrobiaceae bacterium]|nr:class II aldolase/adducin family protein [Terrimicrobiaceae bacterium]
MKLFAQKEAEAFARTGAREFRYNRETRLTPGAKDVFSEAGIKLVFDAEAPAPTPAVSAAAPASTSDDQKLFHSPEAERIKKEICDIGRRIWMREYCDGNGGNISARLGPDRFIITPTGVSKGFMTPDMLCMVDLKGNQLAGTWKRSSEFTTHAAIYETTPEAVSVCHAHPCHAGAFAIKELQPPPRLIPELEVFVGQVAVAGYQTPGSPEMAEVIKPLAPKHQSIIMGCHGVICWGKSVEDAYFKMEITDAYCRTVILAQALPGAASIPCEKMDDLLRIKKSMGLPDNRYELKNAELCEVDPWEQMCGQRGCATPVTPFSPMTPPSSATPADMEALVQKLTDEILANLNK